MHRSSGRSATRATGWRISRGCRTCATTAGLICSNWSASRPAPPAGAPVPGAGSRSRNRIDAPPMLLEPNATQGPPQNNLSLLLQAAAVVVLGLRECRAVVASGLARPGFHDPGLKPTYLVALGAIMESALLHDQTGVLMICGPQLISIMVCRPSMIWVHGPGYMR